MTLKTFPLDFATFLKDHGYGVLGKQSSGVEISVSGYYEATNNAIFITLSGASDFIDVVGEEEKDTKKNIQIIIRNTTHQTCLDTWESLTKLLQNTMNTTIGSTKITGFEESLPSGFLRKSNSGYWMYVLNFIVYFEE